MAACLNCGSDNAADARFCAACGSPLAVTCSVCGSSIPPDARFCPSCGTPVDVATGAATEERKVVSILFADVTGSTELGEQLDPERFRQVMQAYAGAMREEIEAEGGSVEKFIGDAVMAAFGVPVAHEDDPERALRAASRMLRRLDDLNVGLIGRHGVSLQIRIGVNTGEVLATPAPRPGEAMVTGDAVNAAARLEAAAEPGSVLVAERTARAVRGFTFEDRGAITVKGKSRPISVFELLGGTGAAGRGIPGLTAPMVGRDSELDVLRSIFERAARESRAHLVTIYGDAGVGKSRLTAEFLRWVETTESSPLVLRGRCLSYGDGITYWPLAEILKSHAGILDSDPPELALEKVRKAGRELFTEDVAADPRRATAALAFTVGLEDPEVSLDAVDPREVADLVHAAWRSFFTALASERPAIVVVEDIHWADPSLLDLLEELADRVEGPALFVCPSRPDLTSTRPAWGGGRRNMSSLALDPLSGDDAERLVRLLLTVDDLPMSVHGRILERAEGNPFYLEEIVRRLIDGGQLVRDGDRWHASAGIEDVDIPDTVQAVLASRIDLLDASDKRVLQVASVVGRVFWTGPVSELLDMPAHELDAALRRMEERELVLSRAGSTLSGQREYIFKHILTRDVAYESLPRRERGDVHSRTASWLERTAGNRAGEFAEVLAYHYATAAELAIEADIPEATELRRHAVGWLLRASEAARRRLVPRRAARLAQAALGFASDGIERTDALEALGEAFMVAYTGDLAWRYFREAALEGASTEGTEPRRVAYLAARAAEVGVRWPGSIRGALPTEGEVLQMMDLGLGNLPAGDSEERVRLLSLRAGWSFAFPHDEVSDEELEALTASGKEAAAIALRLDRPDLASFALDNAQGAWATVGNYARAIPVWHERGEVMAQVSDLFEIGDYYSMGAWGYYELGEYPRCLAITEEGLGEIEGRAPGVEIHLRSWRSVVQWRLGAWDDALSGFVLMRELLDDRRDEPPYFAAHAFAAAAMIHDARGDRIESDRLTDTLTGLDKVSGRLYPFLLRLLLRRGELERAAPIGRPIGWAVHRGDAYEAESERIAALAAWDEATPLVEEMRLQAMKTGTTVVPAFADRLEGQAALAAGDAGRAAQLLTAAADRFDDLGAVWERALTQLELAIARASTGDRSGAEEAVAAATRTFETLGAVKDLVTARATLARL